VTSWPVARQRLASAPPMLPLPIVAIFMCLLSESGAWLE
jgi:hypothetical protein